MIFDLRKFSDANWLRCRSADGFNHDPESWSFAEWTNAIAGEAGEACNIAKKLIRFRDGVAGNIKPEDQDPRQLAERLAKECADVIIYADLTIQALGFDTATAVREVFNDKSRQMGIPHRFQEQGDWVQGVVTDVQTLRAREAPQCEARESGGHRCELPEGHEGSHACPGALLRWEQGHR